MTSTLPEDPYHALGLAKDATPAAIKTAYRKLVLKHHPDKVQDDSLKQAAADLFHKIQTAWETIGDEDKRARYDAQCRLASLRKEAAERDRYSGGGTVGRPDVRPSPFRAATDAYAYSQAQRDANRVANYRTEEIRPSETDYFDKVRTSNRRDYDAAPDRSRRTPPKDDRQRSRLTRQDSKESERARQREKVRQTTKATARDRDYKYSRDVESDSDSDRYVERTRRSLREREDERRMRERYSEARKQEDAIRYADERTQITASMAKEYMRAQAQRQYSGSAKQTSPTRQHSDSSKRISAPIRVASRDQTEYKKGSDGRPMAYRRSSGRPRTSRDDDEAPRRPRRDERSGSDYEDAPRRPPTLSQAKSAPNNIHLPYDKPRANSAQLSREQMADFAPSPVKRADSMPLQSRNKPVRSSTLRQTQLSEEPERKSSRSAKEYADDFEKPTPDGYVIEPRAPPRRTTRSPSPSRRSPTRRSPTRRMTRSPSPIREKNRSASTRYPMHGAPVVPPINTRTTSTTYTYSPDGNLETVLPPRLSRGESGRKDSYLFGEVPVISPKSQDPYTTPPPENIRYREIRPEYKMQSGYSTTGRRGSEQKLPTYRPSVPA